MSILDPVWIKPASITKKTLDPLGLDRVSDRLAGGMLTGITSLTTRARYYSFYVWVIKNVNETEKIDRFDQFENAFFDRERTYCLACISHEHNHPTDDHSNIQGSIKGRPKWRDSGASVNMYGFRHLGNRLGGYGYYYQASIRNLGLTELEQIRDVLTPLGVELAKSFERGISQTEYFRKFMGKDNIPKSILTEYGTKCCVCLLHNKTAPDRNMLRDILLGMNPESKGNTVHQRRQDTLTLILYIVHFLSHHSKMVSDQIFLDIAYFHQFMSNNNVIDFVFPQKTERTLERWKMFRSHDYFAYACESLFHSFLETLDTHRTTGLSFSEFMSLLDNLEFVNELSAVLGKRLNAKSSRRIPLDDILREIVSTVVVTQDKKGDLISDASQKFDSSCKLDSKMNEYILTTRLLANFDSKEFSLIKSTVLASLVLLLLYVRFYWRIKTENAAWKWLIQNSETDLSPSYLVFHLEKKLTNSSFTVFDFLDWIYRDYVLTQAVSIYNQKVGSSLYSRPISWFHQDGEVYRIDREYYPRFRNSRFDSCLGILSDLGLCKLTRNYFGLTSDGKELLKNLEIEVK